MIKVKVGDLFMATRIQDSLGGNSAWQVLASAELPAPTGIKILLWAKAIEPVMEAYNGAHRRLFMRLAENDDGNMVIRPNTPQHSEYKEHMARVHDMEVSLPVEHIKPDDISDVKLPTHVLQLCSFVFAGMSIPEVDIPDFGLDEEA